LNTITGKVNFLNLAYGKKDFYKEMKAFNCEIVSEKRFLFTYTFKVKGRDEDLAHARWYFNHG